MTKEISGIKYSVNVCLFALIEYKKVFGTITDVNRLHIISSTFDWSSITVVSEANINNFSLCLNNNGFDYILTKAKKKYSTFSAFNNIDGPNTVSFLLAIREYSKKSFESNILNVIGRSRYTVILYKSLMFLSGGYHKKTTIEAYERDVLKSMDGIDFFKNDFNTKCKIQMYKVESENLEIIKTVYEALKDQKPCTFEQVENEVKKHINLV